jgi:hypothetical protein
VTTTINGLPRNAHTAFSGCDVDGYWIVKVQMGALCEGNATLGLSLLVGKVLRGVLLKRGWVLADQAGDGLDQLVGGQYPVPLD